MIPVIDWWSKPEPWRSIGLEFARKVGKDVDPIHRPRVRALGQPFLRSYAYYRRPDLYPPFKYGNVFGVGADKTG